MITKIDWISFSFEVSPTELDDERLSLPAARRGLERLHPDLPEFLAFDDGFEAGHGRAPYRTGWKHASEGYTLFTNPVTPHALIEISGKGCDFLADGQSLRYLLETAARRVTRLDIAQDILCAVTPFEFTDARLPGRFRSHSQAVSDHGSTSYIGSRKSNRYCRVYRYNPPHPRSAFLRVEYSVKAEDATLTCASILEHGLEATGAALGNAFGWQHPIYREDAADPAELATWRPERREGNTVFWLTKTIAPLLARMHNEKTIDLYEFLTDHVIPNIVQTVGE